MITDVKKAAELLKSNDDFLILSHANPDGDTLGCAYGLCGMLRRWVNGQRLCVRTR